MNKHLLNRRQFNARCAALGAVLPALGTTSKLSARTVQLPDGPEVPALGQGCWHLGQGRHPAAVEEEALRTGISLGMTLIDTSGNYGGGRSEEFLKHVIAGQRDRIFLVTKVEANEVSGDGIARACAASLARLGSGYIDLYLLHWPVPSAEFSAVVASFEKLRATGKIRAWGVSNFDTAQMEGLMRVPDGHRCATLAKIAAIHDCSPSAIALAWAIRSGSVIAIPESGSPTHAKENAAALSIALTPQDLQALELAFPRPLGAT